MGRKEEIMEAFEKLNSTEGRVEFLMTRTLLSRERTKAIDRLGDPWPVPPPRGFEGMDQHLEALQRGEVSNEEGVNHLTATEAYTQMLGLEIESKGSRQEIDTLPPPGWEPDDRITDHLQEVATLSGESYDTLSDFYLAYLAYRQRIYELIGQFSKAR